MTSIQDRERIKQDLKNSTQLLVETLKKFPTDRFNKKPGVDMWSAGDVAEHLWIIETAVNEKVMAGKIQQTERDPMEKIKAVKTIFLDFEMKFSAKLSKPTTNPKDKEDIIDKIKSCRQKLMDIVGTTDLEQECLGFNHSIFGLMTKIEWIYYNIYHTERHIQQIDRIYKEIIKTPDKNA